MSGFFPRPAFPWILLRFYTRRLLLAWCMIAAIIFAAQLANCAIVHDNQNVKAMLTFINVLPPMVKGMLGGSALQMGNSNALIAIGYQHPLVLLLFMLYAVGSPTLLLTGEVQTGTMELILSRVVTKTQVYICAAVPTMAGMAALVLVMFLGTVAGTSIYDFGTDVPLGLFFRLAVCGGVLAGAVGAIALLSAAWCKQRNTAVGITVSYLVVDYFAHVVGRWWPKLAAVDCWTLFYYVKADRIFVEGAWPWDGLGVLAGVLAGAALLGGVLWNRRDLPL